MSKVENGLAKFALVGLPALTVLGLQVLALISLEPGDFGLFSTVYLLFAFANSLSLSLISDAWLRHKMRAGWGSYSSTLVHFLLIFSALAFVLMLLLPVFWSISLPATIAIFFASYRAGSRYYALVTQKNRSVVLGDLLGLVALVIAGLSFWLIPELNLNAIIWIWAISSVASVIGIKAPSIQGAPSFFAWFKQHKREIRELLPDSLLMDASSIGTPYFVLAFLGLANFGTYRAVSNVAAPVRLVLNPIRPIVATWSMRRQRSLALISAIFIISILFAIAAYGALLLLEILGWDLGTLNSLIPFAIPTALFVAASFFGHYYYLIARSKSSGKDLLIGRLIQTILGIALPILGVILLGLEGAIWAYALAVTCSGLTWTLLLLVRGRDLQTPTTESQVSIQAE